MLKLLNKVCDMVENVGVCHSELNKIKKLREKLIAKELTISVIGQFKRGKSSLVNILLEEDVMPVGIVPVTSAVSIVKYGETLSSKVRYNNGLIEDIDPKELDSYISEQQNPDNKLDVGCVYMFSKSDFLKGGITLVDTPGVGSVHKHNSVAAYDFVKQSDAVIFVLSVDSPINEIEIDFLKNAAEYASKFYFLVNKIDVIGKEDLEVYRKYCQNLISQLMNVESINLIPVSAKTGEGIEEFKKELSTDYSNVSEEILEESIKLKLKDIINKINSQVSLYWRAVNLPVGKRKVNLRDLRIELKEISKIKEEIKEKVNTHLKDTLSLIDTRKYSEELKKEVIMTIAYFQSNLRVDINRVNMEVADAITEIFNIEYEYDFEELDLAEDLTSAIDENEIFKKSNISKDIDGLKEDIESSYERIYKGFCAKVDDILSSIEETLNNVLMYNEKSVVTMVYKKEDLINLKSDLKRIKRKL